MHWFWIVCISLEVILMLLVTMIERNAIVNRINGANGFIWYTVITICVMASIVATLGSWVMVGGLYALKVAGAAAVLHFVLGASTLTYLDRLGRLHAKKAD
jgi:predicted phage tail protein